MTEVKIYQETFGTDTTGQGFTDITEQVSAIVKRSKIKTGLCTVFIQHTSASLIIQENADPAVQRDLARWMAALVPESDAWEHIEEGPDDMPSHVRTMLTRTSEMIPIQAARLALGRWQSLYLWEHRREARTRFIIVQITGVA
ncbi:MAG: secondary thiamine-phosphate synthase enzyme YjbQ [Acidobacteriota bacterium]